MSITPKNWASFQHYKDRSPIWIKLHRSLLDDFEYHCLPVDSRALAPMLWLLASEYADGAITASNKEIAFRMRMPVADLERALIPLIDGGFFVCSDTLAERKQPAMPEKRREETEVETETDTRSQKRPRAPKQIDLEEAIAATAPGFDAFWQAFPRRDGPNPRKPAEQKFNALVKTGVDPAMLIAEAKKLATAEGARGNIGTRFIPQAATWLNQARWSDHAAVAMLAAMAQETPEAHAKALESAVSFYARTGVWSRQAGPEPGQIGCRAPIEILAKHGLGPDGLRLREDA